MSTFRTKKSLLEAMQKSRPDDENMISSITKFCKKEGIQPTDLVEDLPKKVADQWESHERFVSLCEWFARPPEPKDGRLWFDDTKDEFLLMESSISLMRENFVVTESNGRFRLYRIKDHAKRVVEEMIIDTDVRPVTRTITATLKAEGCVPNPLKVKRIIDYFMDNDPDTVTPILCAQPDQNEWCLHKITTRPDPEVTEFLAEVPETDRAAPLAELMPTFWSFLGRMNDPEAFAAWMYGIYSDRFKGRQMLWVQGKGKDGKSLVFDAFTETVFGVVGDTVSWNVIKNQPEYVTAMCENKKFVYVADCSNPKILLSEVFKSLSGADRVTINRKHQQQYNTRLEAKLAVISNYSPFIKGETHSLSRILPIKMAPREKGQPDNENYREEIIQELPVFLAYGERCYAERSVNNTDIKPNAQVMEWIESRVDASNEEFDAIIAEHFVLDLDAEGTIAAGTKFEISRLDMFNILTKDVGIKDTNKISEIKEYLFDLGMSENTKRKVYRGVRKKMLGESDIKKLVTVGRTSGAESSTFNGLED